MIARNRGEARPISPDMQESRIVLPTVVRLQEEAPEPGGWSRFFDEAVERIEVDVQAELREEIDG